MIEAERDFANKLVEVVHSGAPCPWNGWDIYENLMETIKNGKVVASAIVADKPETSADDIINCLYDELSQDRIIALEKRAPPTHEEIEACAARSLASALEDENGWMAIYITEVNASDGRSVYLCVEHIWDFSRFGTLGAFTTMEAAIMSLLTRFEYYCDIWDWSPTVPAKLRSRIESLLSDRNPLTKSHGVFGPARKT